MSTSSESDQWSSSDNEQEISSYNDDSATSVGELEFHSAEEFSPSDEEPNNEEPARRTTRSRPGNQRSGNPRLRLRVKPQPEPDSVILAEVDRRLDEVDLVRPTEPPIVQTELTEPERIMAPFINQMGGADYKACVQELTQFEPHELRGVRIDRFCNEAKEVIDQRLISD